MINRLRIQISVNTWNNSHIIGTESNGNKIIAAYPSAYCYHTLPAILYKGCRINLLSCTEDTEGTMHPRDIIYEPDCLIDISALARCVQPYGSPAIGYILNLLESSEDTSARLLGEAANIFLDDCVNERHDAPATYRRSMERFFREYPLQLSVCQGIDKSFFDNAYAQFNNIQQKMGTQGINSAGGYSQENVQLEPSFFCEALGLQGRIDLLQGNGSMLIELKSGKADEFNGCSKEEHRLQMSLYKEMLCYALEEPRNSIRPLLFYSRYPRFFSNEASESQISEALMLRNNIVKLLQQMCKDGLLDTLLHLSPDELNTRNNQGRLWTNYLRPRIEKILLPMKEADTLLLEYIFGNIAFVAREMMVAKVGNSNAAIANKRQQSGRSFADVWNAPLEEKIENGNILIDLEIKKIESDEGDESITDITFTIANGNEEHLFPNFRAGDTVFVYCRNNSSDTAVNRQVTRGTLTAISPTELTLHLRHKQRNRTLYSTLSHYAIEHDHLDSTFRSSLRDLYSLFDAPQERIDLLLAQREPRFDNSRTLTHSYSSEYIDNIVLKAKQAKDIFMLIGPPGTGKTSQALSSMVREFNSEKSCNILLASYTNRAVDEICQTLEQLPEQPQYVRIGSEQSCLPQYRHRLLKNRIADCKNREEIRSAMQETTIFVGTIASLTARKELFKLKKFHVAIIDEATQILESQMAGLLAAVSPDGTSAIEKFILIGDPKQLPAVVAQSPQESIVKSPTLQAIGINDYGASLFERLFGYYHNKEIDGLTATLSRQGRMHPIVSDFANHYFYNDRLHPIPLPHQTEELTFEKYNSNNIIETIIATRRTAFIATKKPNAEKSDKVNRPEAEAIALFVKQYHKLHCENGIECNPSKEIGIIVPFRNQIAMVAHAIAALDIPHSDSIVIDTVERFQGSQREMILFGTTISDPQKIDTISSPIVDAEGVLIDRKLNVALTRARRRMYVFGNREALSASPLYKALMDELEE